MDSGLSTFYLPLSTYHFLLTIFYSPFPTIYAVYFMAKGRPRCYFVMYDNLYLSKTKTNKNEKIKQTYTRRNESGK